MSKLANQKGYAYAVESATATVTASASVMHVAATDQNNVARIS